jgi:N-hydroxyarylamine O-acetyltransferase
MTPNLPAYLARIGFQGQPRVDAHTLRALHQAHLLAISYENLDIHLGRALTLETDSIYEKIVQQGRGGWCYEMNGLFAWALREMGFSVTLLASAVNRAVHGLAAERNHLILRVRLERDYLVDVGFGNGFFQPLPLEPGLYQQGWQAFELAQMGDHWRLIDHGSGGPGYDFTLEPRQMGDFAAQCQHLQTAPDSGFVRAMVCYRFMHGQIVNLRGLVLRRYGNGGLTETTLQDERAYHRTLTEVFGLRLPDGDLAHLWQIAWAKHQAFLESG